jgi:hypothetical protein
VIEFAERKGLDDRGTSLDRRGALGVARGDSAAGQNQDRDQETQRPAHPLHVVPRDAWSGAGDLYRGK